MSDRLLTLAAAHCGVLSAADARSVDVDANALAALVRSGALRRVRRSAYVVGQDWAAATSEQRLALCTRAVLRSRGRAGEWATHQSALAVHGLPLFGVPTDVVDIAAPVVRIRKPGNLRIHPADHRSEVVEVEGCRTVSIEVALAQVALREGRVGALVPADRALATGTASLHRVTELVHRLAGSRRVAVRVEQWLSEADGASESVGETRARLLLLDLGHDVRSQVRISDDTGRVGARVDLLVGDRVVVEFDGLVKYEGAEGRAALAAEKRREDWLRSLGYEVVRLTWADLERPRRVDALVRSALERATGRHARPAS
jgi:very-short-patch-repair endonuclease